MIGDARSRLPRPGTGQSQTGRPGTGQSGTGQSETGAPAPLILDQAFDADSLYALRAAVAAHASQAGLSPGRADDLVIAVHELAANAVRHGAGHGRLRIWKSDHALRCEVSDNGAPQPVGDAAAAAADQPKDQAKDQSKSESKNETKNESKDSGGWPIEPGHGLALVSLIADKSSVSSGPSGTLATISFALSAQGVQVGLTRQHLDGCTVLAIAGPLDHGTGDQLIEAIEGRLAEAPDLPLVLDLSGLAGWDSAGLTALIAAQRRVGAVPGARMVLAALPDQLNQNLHRAALADQFTLADSTAAAAAALNR
jgi:anti-anti-sigma factor